MEYNLKISGKHYKALKEHLYPGDGKEAVAVAMCGRYKNKGKTSLLIHEIIMVPYGDCSIRSPYLIKWATESIIPLIDKASKKGLAVLKIHSHPNGFSSFSDTDNQSDRDLFKSVYGWMDDEEHHGSAIMLPDGKIFGRIIHPNLNVQPIDKITVVADDILIWFKENKVKKADEFAKRTAQAFGDGTTGLLKKLKIAVIGCSGTGSPLIEQLVRLGVGHLVLVDPDKVEEKNLNRIVNSTMADAKKGYYKVNVLEKAIKKIGLGTRVSIFSKNLYESQEAIDEIAGCDAIFGCVDSIDGRHLINQIATFYLVPYFDLGVKLTSDGKGGIDQIVGSVHYLQPGGSSLRTRRVYSEEGLRAASMYRVDIKGYKAQKKSGYIVDVVVNSPAVISINTNISSMAVNEFLARIHPYRYNPNSHFAVNRIDFTESYQLHEEDGEVDSYLSKFVGRGNAKPMLNMPELN